MGPEHTEEETTDPMVSARPRGPSPTPVSHVGASARTVVAPKRIGAATTSTTSPGNPSRQASFPWVRTLVVAGVLLVVVGAVVAVIVLPDRLGAWATSPEEGSRSALEPVTVDPDAEPAAESEGADPGGRPTGPAQEP